MKNHYHFSKKEFADMLEYMDKHDKLSLYHTPTSSGLEKVREAHRKLSAANTRRLLCMLDIAEGSIRAILKELEIIRKEL